ncbi:MAG: hypothetical protein PHG66_00320 [Candidatus Colwellbacteria bacterium]|nr:hypothetical protein [Candidatus Colwellbacteria bacterium]
MDRFLSHLIDELDLQNFGVVYEDLVPITCSLKWTQITPSAKIEFTSTIMKYLLPRAKIDKEYLILQSRIRACVEVYWRSIVGENLEFGRIKNQF